MVAPIDTPLRVHTIFERPAKTQPEAGHGLLLTYGLTLCILEGSFSVIRNSTMFVLG